MYVCSLWALFFSILFGIGAAAGFIGAMKMLAGVL